MADVAGKSPAPIATGERYFNVYQVKMEIERRAMPFARVSVGLCGGITAGLRITAIAEANNVHVASHNPISPIGVAACAATGFSRANVRIQEYPTGYDNLVLESTPELLSQSVIDGRLNVQQGFMLRVDDRPGLGVN